MIHVNVADRVADRWPTVGRPWPTVPGPRARADRSARAQGPGRPGPSADIYVGKFWGVLF